MVEQVKDEYRRIRGRAHMRNDADEEDVQKIGELILGRIVWPLKYNDLPALQYIEMKTCSKSLKLIAKIGQNPLDPLLYMGIS